MRRVWFWSVSLALFRCFFIPRFDLLPDEAYYWTWSRHLAPCYLDHPPFVAWLIRSAGLLLGQSEFSVRVWAVVLSLSASLVLARLAASLFRTAAAAGLAFFLASFTLVFAVGGVVLTPDTPFLFLWTGSLYALWRALTGPRPWWLAVGLLAGLGLLAKYSMVLFFPCGALFLAWSDEARPWLRRPEPYLAALLAGVVFLPVLLWNAGHGWASFLFQWHHGMQEGGLSLKTLGDYVGGQALAVTPLLFLACLGAAARLVFRAWLRPAAPQLFCLCFSLPVFLLFGWASLRGHVEVNWPAFGYPALFLALAGDWGQSSRQGWGVKTTLASVAVLFVLVHCLVLWPVYPVTPDLPFMKRLYGWRELGQRVDRDCQADPALIVGAESYQVASEILFYSSRQDLIFLGGHPALHPLYSFQPQTSLTGRRLLLVTEGPPRPDLLESLGRIQNMPPLSVHKNGQFVKDFSFTEGLSYKGNGQ